MTKKDGDDREIFRALAMLTQIGLTMAACVFVGVLAGKYFDRILGTSPWLLVLGAVLGAVAAFKCLYDMVIKEWL